MSKSTAITINSSKPFYPVTDLTPVLWNESGYFLNSILNFSVDPLLYGGAYMLQEAGSMILGEVLKQVQAKFTTPIKVLDLCASFGANATQISSVLSSGTLLVANEPNKQKCPQLKATITRWGLANTLVSNNNITDFSKIEGFFDVIVVANTTSKEEQNIIEYVLPALKPGGFVIYLTAELNQKNLFTELVNQNELKSVVLEMDASWKIGNAHDGGIIAYTIRMLVLQ
jgi:precorrin-6B methylase 2